MNCIENTVLLLNMALGTVCGCGDGVSQNRGQLLDTRFFAVSGRVFFLARDKRHAIKNRVKIGLMARTRDFFS